MNTDPIKPWEVQTSTGRHFDVLDGIRGLAILMVVAFHAFYTNPESNVVLRAIGGIIGAGWLGVPIFFVLSGFLISYPFFRRRKEDNHFWHLTGYARRRVGKIIPPYYLSIVIFAVYYFVRFSDPAYLRVALQWALGLPNFLLVPLRFNASYWSLIVEVHFYIALPLLFFLTRGLKALQAAVCLFFMLLVVPTIVRQVTWPQQEPTKDLIGFLMTRFPSQLDFFAWGILFSGIFVSLSGRRSELRALSLCGYAGLVLLAVSLGLWALWSKLFEIHVHPTRWSIEIFHLLPSVSAFLMLFFVFDHSNLGARFLAQRWLRFVGLVSYEWFLFHQPVIYLFKDIFGQTHGSIPMFALKTILPMLLTFGASVIVYRYFSLPLLNRIRARM
jgi:peptidoglycan/LPS O-acetylase OafA/YrhL